MENIATHITVGSAVLKLEVCSRGNGKINLA